MTTEQRLLWQQAFGDSQEFIDSFCATVYRPENSCQLTLGGKLAAALYWMDCETGGQKLAYLYAVATGKEFRGRGYCRMLLERTHAILADRGYAGSLLVPGEAGLQAMYEKMGYRVCTSVMEILCKPSTPISLETLTAQEYAARRRALLGDSGVVQEAGAVEFLSRQAQLYGGEGFVAAISRDGKRVFCTELLGDTGAASGILAVLGETEGIFRIRGNVRPFAMYRPITDAPAPDYLGLAFD